MIPIKERAEHRQFTAFAAHETIEHIWPRVERLVKTGRRIVYVERWLDGGDLTVSPGLQVHEGGFKPGAHCHKDFECAGFTVTLMPGIRSIGAAGWLPDGTEADAAKRFHARRDGTRIHVEGFGDGRNDHVEVTDWNEYGVGHQRALYFDFEESEQRAAREGLLLDRLAYLGTWKADALDSLAKRVRYEQEPAHVIAQQVRGTKIPGAEVQR